MSFVLWIVFIMACMCLGSFLSLIAYRLVHHDVSWSDYPHCPHCRHTLSLQELIPVISWIFRKGRCAHCHHPISFLYPALELIAPLALCSLIIMVPASYYLAYGIFFCALLISIFTDCSTLLISYFVTLFLIPLGFLFSYTGHLPITLTQSIIGAAGGFGILWATATLFYLATHRVGMGAGDFDLLAFIGAFTGTQGWWCSLLIGSFLGSFFGLYLMYRTNDRSIALPFGPFLALGAMSYVLWGNHIMSILIPG